MENCWNNQESASYEDRLKELGLIYLKKRWFRGNLINCQILKGRICERFSVTSGGGAGQERIILYCSKGNLSWVLGRTFWLWKWLHFETGYLDCEMSILVDISESRLDGYLTGINYSGMIWPWAWGWTGWPPEFFSNTSFYGSVLLTKMVLWILLYYIIILYCKWQFK